MIDRVEDRVRTQLGLPRYILALCSVMVMCLQCLSLCWSSDAGGGGGDSGISRD